MSICSCHTGTDAVFDVGVLLCARCQLRIFFRHFDRTCHLYIYVDHCNIVFRQMTSKLRETKGLIAKYPDS